MNTVVSSHGKDYSWIYNGSIVRIYDRERNNITSNDIYMLVAYPKPKETTAGLILIMLSTGACYSTRPMDAGFDSAKPALYVTRDTFATYLAGKSWEFVKSVTITGEDV